MTEDKPLNKVYLCYHIKIQMKGKKNAKIIKKLH